MTKKLNILMSTAAAVVLLAPSAFAWEEDTNTVYVDQVQLDQVWSQMNVHLGEHTDGDIGVGATSVGNTASGAVMSGDISVNASQEMHANTTATTNLGAGDVSGAVYATTTSYANAASGGTWNGNTGYLVDQENSGLVRATTNVHVRNVNKIATSTTAIANVSTPSSEHGDNRSFSHQVNTGSSVAATNATVCCANESANFSTVAGGNAVTSTGSSSTTINGAVQLQAEHTSVNAASNVLVYQAENATSSASAVANSYTLSNEWGYATLGRYDSPLYQGNGASVNSESNIHLENWDGHAVSSSYGVGNSALIANAASSTGLYANQENFGTVSSFASLGGNSYSGGTGVVHSTAIGNAATATLCTMCGDGVLQGSVNQMNGAASYAGANIYTGHAGNIYGSATAVGNSASFTSGGD